MTTQADPVAALEDRAVWDDMPPEDRAMVTRLRTAFYDYEPAATPDPDFVARKRAMLVALATTCAAPNVVPDEDEDAPEDWFIDESVCASTWLGAIADHAYSLPPDDVADDVPLYGFRGDAR